jgi:hypothetical protein
MTLKETGMQMVIDAQDKCIKELTKEIQSLRIKNLKLKMDMQVLVMHPVGLATRMISKKYTRQQITKELQISTQN